MGSVFLPRSSYYLFSSSFEGGLFPRPLSEQGKWRGKVFNMARMETPSSETDLDPFPYSFVLFPTIIFFLSHSSGSFPPMDI